MGLNIKNERVHEMARRAAELTGTTQTGAIEEALRLLLAAHGEDPEERRTAARIDAVHGIVARYAASEGDPERSLRSIDDLYDDAGMPR